MALKHLPEVTVTFAFIPMGVFMGYIMQYYFAGMINFNSNIHIVLINSKWWPLLSGSGAAILTGIILFSVKLKFRQYRYEHLYFVFFSMLMFFIAGILFLSVELPYAAIYMSAIAHGISYIAALTYLNIRMGKTKFRFLRLSIPLIIYMLCVAVGSTVVYAQLDFDIINAPTAPVNNVIGILLIVFSVWTIFFITILEYNEYFGTHKYKSSLDADINRENNNLVIFERKYFEITSKSGRVTRTAQTTVLNNPINGLIFFVFVIMSKITEIIYFYWPFMIIHHFMSILALKENLFLINWFGLAGVIISTILLIPLTYKIQHAIGTGLKVLYMTIILIIFAFDDWHPRELTVVMWFLFLTIGLAYPNADINILSFTNLKNTEFVLVFGYVAVYITVGVIQYITIESPELIISVISFFHLVFAHAITFLVILFALVFVGMFVMPGHDFKSLLELQNYINTFRLGSSNGGQMVLVNVNLQPAPTFPAYGQQQPQHIQMPIQQNLQQPYVFHTAVQQPPGYSLPQTNTEYQLPAKPSAPEDGHAA